MLHFFMLYVAFSWPQSGLCGWQIFYYFFIQGKLVVTFAWQVDPFCSVSAAHDIGENVRHQIHKTHPEVSEAFIHIGKQHSFTWLLLKLAHTNCDFFDPVFPLNVLHSPLMFHLLMMDKNDDFALTFCSHISSNSRHLLWLVCRSGTSTNLPRCRWANKIPGNCMPEKFSCSRG